MHLSENDAVLISVYEPLNYIHQDMKSARLIAVCRRSITLNKFGKRARGCCVHVFLVTIVSNPYIQCIGHWAKGDAFGFLSNNMKGLPFGSLFPSDHSST